jgi:hypothetical protein
MNNIDFSKVTALKEHMLEGYPVTQLEAIVLFGISDLAREISRRRTEGWIIKSKRVPYARALARAREYAVIEPPKNLPIRDIHLTEYWVSQ